MNERASAAGVTLSIISSPQAMAPKLKVGIVYVWQ